MKPQSREIHNSEMKQVDVINVLFDQTVFECSECVDMKDVAT